MENVPFSIVWIALVFIVIVFCNFLYQRSTINTLKESVKYHVRCNKSDLNHFREQLNERHQSLHEANELYNCAYHVNKYWDKILREIYSRYGERARLAPIEYKGRIDGIHNFDIKVNVPGSVPKSKQWKLGEPDEWNYIEMTYHQESFTLLIPEVATEQEERFGKALCEMEVKFD